MTKKDISRRGFLKLLGAFGGFLSAGMIKVVPEIGSSGASYGEVQPERLKDGRRQRLIEIANQDSSFKQLQNYLSRRGFQNNEIFTDAVQVKIEECETEMLMQGFDGPGKGATIFFTMGNIDGQDFRSSFVWIVDEAAYFVQNGEVITSDDITNRMKDVPRLPLESPVGQGSGFTFAATAYADHCACHNEWSACYVWNGLCGSLTVGCVLNPAICPVAAVACLNASANCFVAGQCGPPC